MRFGTYGPGGFDPKKPNNNLVEVEDVPDPAPTDSERLDALVAALENATTMAEVRAAAKAARRR